MQNVTARQILFYSFFVLGSVCFWLPAFAQQTSTEQELDDVKTAIKQQQQTIAETNTKRADLEAQVKSSDLQIANLATSLRQSQQAIADANKTLQQLSVQQNNLIVEKKSQESALAAQLRSAYSAGQYDYIKMLLNQQKSSDVQRSLIYYQYLNNARIEEINRFKKTIEELKLVEQQQAQQLVSLTELKNEQEGKQTAFKTEQTTRKALLRALNESLATEQDKLARLQEQEQNLIATLEKLRQQALAAEQANQSQLQLVGLAKLKNKLNWPVDGNLAKQFGNIKQGSLRWKGVLLNADAGKTVNTIYQGKVLFSDWLKGYGLVTVIDHGEGYMSLYGHNQTLLKQVGDIVETGEPIALVGQSGGQSTSGLYFEIRHNGQAVNPKHWCKG